MVISAVGTDHFVILVPHPSFLLPPRAGVGTHQHEQLFVLRYLLHSSVQGRPECVFVTSIFCVSVGAYAIKKVTALARTRSSSVTFSKRSLIKSGGRAARGMKVLTYTPTLPCPARHCRHCTHRCRIPGSQLRGRLSARCGGSPGDR